MYMMAGRLRSSKASEFEIGEVFEKVIKGLRHEMSGVLENIERSRNLSLEDMKGLLRNSLEAVVGSVESLMCGISDEIASDRKRREGEERKRDEWAQGLEQRSVRERKKRDLEGKKWEERLHRIEEIEKEQGKKLAEMERLAEEDRCEQDKEWKRANDRLRKMEERLEQASKEREQIGGHLLELERSEKDYRKEEAERTMQRQKVVMAKESEKEMEGKVGVAMEELKILDLDFGKVIVKREEIVKDALDMIKENVKLQDRKEWDWNVQRSRIYVLGHQTKEKEFEGRKIFTVPILIKCCSARDKERMERLIRNAGIRVSVHWPKELLGYVKGIREKVEGMGNGGNDEFVRVRPVKQDGVVLIRADVRKKEGGRFRWVADWKCPPMDKELWPVVHDVMRPGWIAVELGNRN
jgi:hypothetical protein